MSIEFTDAYIHRLRTLFWISVTNFVFPTLLNIVQLILVYRDAHFLDGIYVFLVNNYVGIIGALLATVWSSSSHWSSGGGIHETENHLMPLRIPLSTPGVSRSLLSEADINYGQQVTGVKA